MIKINKITAICALLAAAATVSCTGKFEDFNTNRHEATEEQMEQDNLKTGAFFRQLQRSVVLFEYGTIIDSDYQIAQNLSADSYAGYLTGTISGYNDGANMGAYAMSPDGWVNAQYNFSFTYAMPAWKSLCDAADELEQPEIAALGTVVKVTAMHRTTDYYGPIPYVSFGNGQINNSYDTQEAVYRKFFEELDEAIDTLTAYAAGNPGVTIMPTYDYIYEGDVTKWIKFANTLRLRLAMRVVYADEALARTEAQKSLNHTYGCLANANDGAQVHRTGDLVTYHHALFTIVTSFVDDGSESTMGASIDAYMNGYNDPRRSVYFQQAGIGGYHGVRPGIHTTNWGQVRSGSGNVSDPIVDNTTMNIVWMNASEAYFLKAEAALRGWGGDAQSLYEQGIRMSFEERGAGSADNYIASKTSGSFAFTATDGISNSYTIQNVPSVAWDEGAGDEQKLERIMIQKWISMFPNGPEGWAEARRTGYPRLVPVANNDSNGAVASGDLIRRIVFPPSEYTNNPAGVASGIAALGGMDNAGTHLWWDKKNN